MKKILLLLAAAISYQCSNEKMDLTQYVDPLIGSGAHGHVFVGANTPYGMVQLGPSSIVSGWDWCSGYHASDNTILGFSHLHLSGTGIGDLQDILFLPVTQDVELAKGTMQDPESGIYSKFDFASQYVEPGYYRVHLDRYDVGVELTATPRVGFHRYNYPQDAPADMVINLTSAMNWDEPVEVYLVQDGTHSVSGYRYSKGWADDQKVYFTALFSQPITHFELHDVSELIEREEKVVTIENGLARFGFDIDGGELLVKVALSPTSIEKAKLNLDTELSHWDFDLVHAEAKNMWNQELSKIKIETEDYRTKRIFYTSLYHTMMAPALHCDVDGSYRGADKLIYENADFVNYTTLSLWDTYRAAQPLMSIIHPEKLDDLINTMLHIYEQQGKLPVWHLMSCETDCMVGNAGVIVVADAMLKGYDGFDHDKAYRAIVESQMRDERGLKELKEYGYIPYDLAHEGLSHAMEFAIADWSVAQVAKQRGQIEDYKYFAQRSKSYEYYFDQESGFVRGLSSTGEFREPFNPFISEHRVNDYCEGNAWQYTWLVPHDIEGLVNTFGSKESFVEKLDSLFVVEGDMGKDASMDITGLIGQYAHGNEPSHHIAYIYQYIGQPWKSADLVREILATLYDDTPEGICGNEDAGQMSAWYLLSSMGFYQVEPAGGRFVFGSPIIDKATLKVEGGEFTIIAHNNSDENRYIESIKLNGKSYDKFYIDFADIVKGGLLEFQMSSTHP